MPVGLLRVTALTALALTVGACSRCTSYARGESRAKVASTELPAIAVGPDHPKFIAPKADHKRLLLDAPALEALRKVAAADSPHYRRVKTRCDGYLTRDVPAGYQAFDWGDAMAELTLCWLASGKSEYAASALRYLQALIDDREQIGDKRGGADVVRADSGYGIRTFGTYAALGYDWLRDAPGMTPELRQRIVRRLDEWLGWYREKGYLRDTPTANYFWGYFTALTFAALAVGDDAPEGRRWLHIAKRDLLQKKVLPAFKAQLKGGDWGEGWQYGELVAAEAALVARAYRTATGIDIVPSFPWLGQVVEHHTHALLPDEKSVYGGGTWAERPAKPSALAMHAIALALDTADPTRAAQARFLANRVLPPLERSWSWVALLAERPGAAEQDPRANARPSLHVAGSGLTLARSDWSRSAVFASLKVGPRIAIDHQDKDDGHFELWRGSDGLLIDAGDSEGKATINHNTLLVEDGGRLLTYAPNQGVWGKTQRTLGFADDGRVVSAIGEFADAYAPKCAREGCSDRAVESMTRSFVFVRPSLLVVRDEVTLEDGKDGVTWAAHTPSAPERDGARTSSKVGASRVDMFTIEPEARKIVVKKEPTPSGAGPHRQNRVFGPMWRIEVESARGKERREFLHWMVASPAESAADPARALRGENVRGAVGVVDGRRVAVVFVTGDTARFKLGEPAELVLMGLKPNAGYTVSATEAGCSIELKTAGANKASPTGVIRMEVCRVP